MPIPTSSSSDEINTWCDEAVNARQAGDIVTAQTAIDRILEQDPDRGGAVYLRGLLALDARQFETARNWVRRAIEISPHPDYYYTLCIIEYALEAYASTVQTARKGLALQPASLGLHLHEAAALFMEGFLDDAATKYRKLLEFQPDNLHVLTNLGIVAHHLDSLEEAERHLRHAIALAPDSPETLSVRGHLGTVLLARGNYEEGWAFYEDRWANFLNADGSPVPHARPQVALPQWRGESPESVLQGAVARARGARLLVAAEQGNGDSLQFVRYLPLALEHFSQVGLVCSPAVRRLFEESLCSRWPALVMLDNGSDGINLDHWDWFCPMMSLPLAFGTRLDSVPASIPYLFADPARAASWRSRLDALPNPGLPRVGVVWAGGHSGLLEDKVRSLTPAELAPLLEVPGIRWISLQKTDDPAKRADAATQAKLTDWMDEMEDFADTAALIENLDLVIAVDTSVAHLAAAMGKPVWMLNRFAGCWRWLRNREDSPWYPTVHLFNQRHPGQWDEVLARLAAALQQ